MKDYTPNRSLNIDNKSDWDANSNNMIFKQDDVIIGKLY